MITKICTNYLLKTTKTNTAPHQISSIQAFMKQRLGRII